MTLFAQFVVTGNHLLIDVPGGGERGIDGLERPGYGATILGHPQALVWRDALSRFLPTSQPQAATA